MAAGVEQILLEQGATYTRPLAWTSGGVAVDITGMLFRMVFKATQTLAGAAVLDLAIGTGITVVSAVGGTFTISITATQTAALTAPSAGFFDLIATYANGTTRARLIQGRYSVNPQVSP